jgi:hypothetical protein
MILRAVPSLTLLMDPFGNFQICSDSVSDRWCCGIGPQLSSQEKRSYQKRRGSVYRTLPADKTIWFLRRVWWFKDGIHALRLEAWRLILSGWERYVSCGYGLCNKIALGQTSSQQLQHAHPNPN